jgi:anaerobic selenocysteine-containing dehydrogenase
MTLQRIRGYCALCISHCGCVSTVEDGVLTKVESDPNHPTGGNFCIKGKAAPELVNSPDRLLTPVKRTRPKGDPDAGWQPISWDEALSFTAGRMKEAAERFGPESVAFSVTTSSGTAISDAMPWIYRLINGFGSPNAVATAHICNWHKDLATAFTFGADSGMPDFKRTGCLVLWGFNPTNCWLAQASAIAEAKKRGMKLIVIDPRQVGLAHKADQWLRVRQGTDGALALGIAGVMIERGWYDRDFISTWSNGPFLIRDDNGRYLVESDLKEDGRADHYVAWDGAAGRPVVCGRGPQQHASSRQLSLAGTFELDTLHGRITCRPAFELYASLCRTYSPERTQQITGVPAEQIRRVAEMLSAHGPVSYYAWSGVGQSTNATQTSRSMCLLYALSGAIDAPGGNVYFAKPKLNNVFGRDLIPLAQPAKTLGLTERPLGPAKNGWITTRELYRAILEEQPYPVKGLMAFGSSLLHSRPSPEEGVRALRKLDFYVHCDLFLTPMAAEADVVLPVSSAWEREGIADGFRVNQEADALLQLRTAVVPPRGESRSDTWIAFELAQRLGLKDQFFNGDIDAGLESMLEPSHVTLETLRAHPEGVALPLSTEYRKYVQHGFATPTGRVEIYSQALHDIGQSALPDYVAPAASVEHHPEWQRHFPLRLTSAKWIHFCHSQFRNLPSLRDKMPDPLIEVHPDTARLRDIDELDWVIIRSPEGAIRARARFNRTLEKDVVCAQYGWSDQTDKEAGADGISRNFSKLISNAFYDPISGSFPLRAYACQLEKAALSFD